MMMQGLRNDRTSLEFSISRQDAKGSMMYFRY
jgi:hypothetical protein